MPASQSQPQTLTLDQYESLPEDMRTEVFDGVPCAMASPSRIHQTISMELSTTLNLYLKKKNGPCRVFSAPFDVKLCDAPLTIVQPDLMIICDTDKLDEQRCNGAPDFVIEIVSPSNPSDDYIRKLYYYKKYGVREYWIVDPRRKTITVNYFDADLLNIQYSFDSAIRVNIYEDLFIDFSEIASLLNV
ncbi:MAG: Uma2 family endonuclease [Lachnospiraceae bacterium]